MVFFNNFKKGHSTQRRKSRSRKWRGEGGNRFTVKIIPSIRKLFQASLFTCITIPSTRRRTNTAILFFSFLKTNYYGAALSAPQPQNHCVRIAAYSYLSPSPPLTHTYSHVHGAIITVPSLMGIYSGSQSLSHSSACSISRRFSCTSFFFGQPSTRLSDPPLSPSPSPYVTAREGKKKQKKRGSGTHTTPCLRFTQQYHLRC